MPSTRYLTDTAKLIDIKVRSIGLNINSTTE